LSLPDGCDGLAAELLEELAGRLQAGEPVDPEAFARAHPECAERLRQLLPAVEALAVLGRSAVAAPVPEPVAPAAGVLGD
jgi:hypothetical protein